MSETIIPSSRGCVFNVRRREGQGFYKLKPGLVGTAECPIILDGPDSEDRDSVFAAATLDDKEFIYTFGKDLGNMAIMGRVLLGRSDGSRRGLQPLLTFFDTYRLSNYGKPISLSYPGDAATRFVLTSLAVGRPDPQFHIQAFSLRGILVKPKNA